MTTNGIVPKTAKRPQPKGGSRKGRPNKVTADLKAMILEALSEAGGAEYLLRQARKKNPAPFMSLLAKVLPMTVAGDPTNPLQITVQRLTDKAKE